MFIGRSRIYAQVVIVSSRAFRAIAISATFAAGLAILPGPAIAATVAPPSAGRSDATSGPPATAARPGGLTGKLVGGHGQPLAGVCVTTVPTTAGARSLPGVRTAVTSASGTFMITGLRVGPYLLRYRNCLAEAGQPARPGAALTSVTAAQEYVTGGHVTMLGPVTVRPTAADPAALMPAPSASRRLSRAQLRRGTADRALGGIAGTVLGPRGRHIKGLCYRIYFPGAFTGPGIGRDGRYNTGKILPPGKYTVGFTAACNAPLGTASANWAPEWYRDKLRQSAASTVVVRAGKITRGISGVMRPGGVISGIVTGHAGRGLGGVCVVAATPKGTGVQQVTTPRSGRYVFRGLGPGRYGIGFFPHCGRASSYLPQWWPGTATETRRGLIKTGFGTRREHVDARLVVGGTLSGVVRFRNRHGRPIKGICVDVTLASQPDSSGYSAASNATGRYAIRGLPAGRYSLFFSPGCDNNGNYLSQSYPHSVIVRVAHVASGINAYLQPGAIVTGTVTAKSGGAPLSGICAQTTNGYSVGETGTSGTYSMDQIPPGPTQIEFYNCDNRGNYAPQFYPDQLNQAAAVTIRMRPGRVTAGINAALAPGATISGTLALPTGRKLSGVCTEAIPTEFAVDLGGNLAESHRGQYAIKDLAPGDYQVAYSSCGGPNVADVWFRGPGSVTGDSANADQIYVPAAGSAPNIDAVLQVGGYIGGRVYGPASLQQSDVCILISDARTGVLAANGFFDVPIGDGYTIFGFSPGRYLVEFSPCGGQNLAVQWYDRAARPARARPVVVRSGHTAGNVNAWMTGGGSIAGHVVSKASGKPLGGVCVEASSISQLFSGFSQTSRSGHYVVSGLSTGTYRLYLSSCATPSLVPLVTSPVKATVGTTVAGPRAAMTSYQAGTISGRVMAAGSPPEPAIGECVDAVPLTRQPAGQLEEGVGVAGPHGSYRIDHLVPGRYKVFFGDPNCADPGGVVPQWYKDASRRSKATVVSVAAGRATGSISATLERYGSISGSVTGPGPAHKPLAGICVQAVPAGAAGAGATPYLAESAGRHGDYALGPLPPGQYLVEFEAGCGASGYATQWWAHVATKGDATPVTVRPARTRGGINSSMIPKKH